MHGVVHTSKVKATRIGHIYSVVSAEDIDNGSIGYVGEFKTGEREIREFLKPETALLTGEEVVVIATPELIYDESKMTSGVLGNFYNEAGLAMVAVPLVRGDEAEVSANMVQAIATKPVAGNYLVPANGSYKLKEVATKPESGWYARIEYVYPSGVSTFIGKNGQKIGNVYDLVHFSVR